MQSLIEAKICGQRQEVIDAGSCQDIGDRQEHERFFSKSLSGWTIIMIDCHPGTIGEHFPQVIMPLGSSLGGIAVPQESFCTLQPSLHQRHIFIPMTYSSR